MMSALANHLWQSTAFAIAIGALAVAFRQYQARVRYALWFAASLKFLVPVSLLIGLGTQLPRLSTPAGAPSPILSTVRQISVPFDAIVLTRSSSALGSSPAVGSVTVVFGIWVCGVLAISHMRWRAWRRLNALVEVATASNRAGLALPPHVDVRSVSGITEPGVLGFTRPIILLPSGIDAYLNRDQLGAVLAHELCHIDRCDNLTAAVHMLVEAVFWFHPVVWWIGAELIHERERACDEHVLATYGTPDVYAESILNVCKHYLGAPLPCMAGVSGGSNLKERITTIIANRIGRRLSVSARVVLVLLGMGAIGVPLLVGAQAPIHSSFEAASVKPFSDVDGPGVLHVSPGRLSLSGVTLEMLIQQAYTISGYRIYGGPPWLDSARYSVVAKAADGDGPLTLDEMRPMLQTLLTERFRLVVHHGTKELPLYRLVVSKSGPKFSESTVSGAPQSRMAMGHITDDKASMDTLASQLGQQLGRFVSNQTRLKGDFAFHVEWTPDPGQNKGAESDSPPPAIDGPSIFAALPEQLGLKLESGKGPVDILVIDHAEKPEAN